MNKLNAAAFEEVLSSVFREAEPARSYVHAERLVLSRYLSKQNTPARRGLLNKWKLAFALLAFIFLAVTVLVIGPQKVVAQIRNWLGFAPEFGFVSGEPLVIAQTSWQDIDGASVQLASGFSSDEETLIHLEYDQPAKPPIKMWLQDADGRRLNLIAWEYTPNQDNAKGLLLHFPPLSGEVSWSLRSSSGLDLPLVWAKASDSQNFSDQQVLAPPGVEIKSPEPADIVCTDQYEIRFCLRGMVTANRQLNLLLAIHAHEPERVIPLIPNPANQVETADNPLSQATLNMGEETLVSLSPVEAEMSDQGWNLTLFGQLSMDLDPSATYTLVIPGILAQKTLNTSLSVDLGPNPQPDQSYQLDETLDLGGFKLRFLRAESLGTRLTLTSETIAPVAGAYFRGLMLGRIEGVEDLYGGGMNLMKNQASIVLELDQPSGRLSGLTTIPIEGFNVFESKPILITFKPSQLPQANLLPPPAPSLAEGTFARALEIPVTAVPFVWHGQYPHSGDLIYLEPEQEQSRVTLYRPSNNFAPQEFLNISASVTALRLHSDLGGVTFIQGELPPDPSHINLWSAHASLWSLRFDQPTVVKLTDLPDYIVESNWSPDGKYLALRSYYSLPANQIATEVYLYDIKACIDDNVACIPQKFTVPGSVLLAMAWDETKPTLALLANEKDTAASQLYLLTLTAAREIISEEVFSLPTTLMPPIRLLSGSTFLISQCENAQPCLFDAETQRFTPLNTQLGSSRPAIEVVNGRWLTGFHFDMQAESMDLLAFDLLSQQSTCLSAISTHNKSKSQFGELGNVASPSTDWLLIFFHDNYFFNLRNGEKLLFESTSLPSSAFIPTRFQWVP